MNEKVTEKLVMYHLEAIMDSDVLTNSPRLQSMLAYLVKKKLSGEENTLSQYGIALGVFGRRENFSASLDPVVRVQAGRLRRRLETYYQTVGAKDELVIGLPRGSYIPRFEIRKKSDTQYHSASSVTGREDNNDFYIAVAPVTNITGDSALDYVSEGFTEELLVNLTQWQYITVIRLGQKGDFQSNMLLAKARFTLLGSLRFINERIKVTMSLMDNRNSEQLWARNFTMDYDPIKISNIQETICSEVTREIGEVHNGIVFRKILNESKARGIEDFKSYDAYFQYIHYERFPDEQSYQLASEKVNRALEIDQRSGLLHALKAELIMDGVVFDFVKNESLEHAYKLSKESINLAPHNQVCRLYFAYCCFLNNEIERAKSESKIAYELNPNAHFYVGAVGWLNALAGDWDEGVEMMQHSMRFNMDYPRWYHIASCINLIRKQMIEEALEEAKKIDSTFWSYALLLGCFNLMGNEKEALVQMKLLLEEKPDFTDKARYLLGMFIKSNELLDLLLDQIKLVQDKGTSSLSDPR